MANATLCEKARLASFFASPRQFDFSNCETETSECFNGTAKHSDSFQ